MSLEVIVQGLKRSGFARRAGFIHWNLSGDLTCPGCSIERAPLLSWCLLTMYFDEETGLSLPLEPFYYPNMN